MKFTLKNSVDKKEYEFTVIDNGSSRTFYKFENFQLPPEVVDGEYEYKLIDSGATIARGLVVIGNYNPENKTVYTENNGKNYIQYGG